jgi:Fe-S-cluster containining protein
MNNDNLEIIKTKKSDKIGFKCTGCGNCCSGSSGYIWLNKQEQINISKKLNLPLKKFLEKYTFIAENKISLKEIKKKENDYWCIFLEKNKKCKIYDVRPHQCKSYPYWKNVVDDKNYLEFVLQDCPGTYLIDEK